MPEQVTEKIKFDDLAQFLPKQKEALEATKRFKYVLYGGTVGSGKSYWLRWCLVRWLVYWYGKYDLKGIRVGLFCEDYPALNDRHLSYIKTQFPSWLGTFNEKRCEFTLASDYGSGVIAFRNLDDAEKYLSVEFAAIAIDEVNRNPKIVFDALRRRLRWPGIEHTKFFAGCNPIGEVWVKNHWIKRVYPPEEKEMQEFFFVKALPSDNPHLPKSYFDSLESQPEAYRKAVLEGDWDAFENEYDEKGWVKMITSNQLNDSYIRTAVHSGPRVLLVDPAAGGDESAIVLKSDICKEILFNQKLQDTMSLIPIIASFWKKHGCVKGAIDTGGLGKPIYDRLKELGFDFEPVNFGESPNDKERFYNRKAELYWTEREWLLKGGKLLYSDSFNEFLVAKYKINSDGKIVIQSKEELLKVGIRSPNVMDASVLGSAVYIPRRTHGGQPFYDQAKDLWEGQTTK